MSSDKLEQKRILRDTFGDDDEDDDDQSQNDDRDYQDPDKEPENKQTSDGADAPDDEPVEEDAPLPSFKKRNADGELAKPVKKKKVTNKSRSEGDGEQNQEGENDLPIDPRQQALMKLEKDFELALKSGKTTRRRNKDEEDLDKDLDESASRFVAKMREAAFSDIDSKLKHQSALAKVRMLESVKKQLNKSHMHNIFLDSGILEAMKLWLEPLHDTSLPSLDIIQDFLDLLDSLPIQTDHLVSSQVGRVVYFYTKVDDSRVTPGIKRSAEKLVDKWSRPIIKLSQDYRDKKINYALGEQGGSSQRRRAVSQSSGAELGPKTLGVRVPQIDRSSYSLMPESLISFDKSRSGKNDKYKKLRSHMAKMKQVR